MIRKLKNGLKRLDRYSPYPLLYKIVMTEREKRFFDLIIKRAENYLEFGLGGSTIRVLQKSKAKIYTVESSKDWIDHMKKYLYLRFWINKRVNIFFVDIGKIADWGFPAKDEEKSKFEHYSSDIFSMIDISKFDLVLIDGRFRVACALKVIMESFQKNKIRILIHDFWNREEYHILLKYLVVLDRVGTLGYFSLKQTIDMKEVENDYEYFKLDPK